MELSDEPQPNSRRATELSDEPQPTAHGKPTPKPSRTPKSVPALSFDAAAASVHESIPSLMDLAAPHCVDGAVARMKRQLKHDQTEVEALNAEVHDLVVALETYRRETSRDLKAVCPREPPPVPREVQALSDAALAAAMSTPSLGEAATAAQLTGSELWTFLQKQIADHEVAAEVVRITAERAVEESRLVTRQHAAKERRDALRVEMLELTECIKRTRIEVDLQVRLLMTKHELVPPDACAAVVAHQEWITQASPKELSVRTGKKKGELAEMGCPVCAIPMRVHALDASNAERAQRRRRGGRREPSLRCVNPDCAVCGFSFVLPPHVQWCHTIEMRALSGGKLTLKGFQPYSWGEPPKQVHMSLPECTSLFVDKSAAVKGAHCLTCKFGAGFSYDDDRCGLDSPDDSSIYDGMNMEDEASAAEARLAVKELGVKCHSCRVRGAHSPDCPLSPENLPMFCRGCRQAGKAYLYCRGSRCGAGPVCSMDISQPEKISLDLCDLKPCQRCSKLRCWSCYEESPGGESGECPPCGRKSEREYEREEDLDDLMEERDYFW